jgi:hypothetical protein
MEDLEQEVVSEILELPLELQVHLLSFVPARDLLENVSTTCQLWWSILKPKNCKEYILPRFSESAESFEEEEEEESSNGIYINDANDNYGDGYVGDFGIVCDECNSKRQKLEALGSSLTISREFPSVWKYKAQTHYGDWLYILQQSPSHFRDYRWLCIAAETLVDKKQLSDGYSGIGHVPNYQCNNLAPNAELEIGAEHNEEQNKVSGSVKYVNSYVGEFVQGKFHGFGMLKPSHVLHQPARGKSIKRQITSGPLGPVGPLGPHKREVAKESVEGGDDVFDYYVGTWSHGQQHGRGFCSWARGYAFYNGEYRKGLRHGAGEYRWSNQTSYVGEFRRNNIWGKGSFSWSDGIIEGSWKLNKQHGKCCIEWTSTGCKFSGYYKYGERVKGTYQWSDGGIYKGEWNNLEREGKAEMKFANGLIFSGTYLNDVREGQGVLIWPNGDEFHGHWSLGRRWGIGTFIEKATGKKSVQNWKEDVDVRYSEKGALVRPL